MTEESSLSSSEINKQDEVENACSNIIEDLEKVELENEEPNIIRDEDFIDEEELKVKEATYSEEERLKFKEDASVHKNEGNSKFKNGQFKESIDCYTQGLRTCPLAYPKDRAILYGNRGAAKVKLGFDATAIDDCTKAVELDPNYIRVLLRRAQLYEKTNKLDESLEDFKKVLELDPSNAEANSASMRLPPLINQRNEELKTEMIGKLRDLGNSLLKPFGLSTENFNMVQDPNTGGYSINFQQN